MEATVSLQIRVGVDEAEALDKVTRPREKNKFLRALLRDELQRRGVLKAAPTNKPKR